MSQFIDIAGTGVTSLVLHPLRSAVTVAVLVTVLVPYLVGIGISPGVQDDANDWLAK